MAQCYYDYRSYFFHSSLYNMKREREYCDDDCCHPSELERERGRESEGKRMKETSSLREKRDRDRVKEHRLTIDVHHCLTSKTDKTLND